MLYCLTAALDARQGPRQYLTQQQGPALFGVALLASWLLSRDCLLVVGCM